MKSWSILSGLVLAGAVMASPASADHGSGASVPGDRTIETQERTSIEGQVAAIERDSGRLVLDTERGPISLLTTPEELEGIEVGDTVRVSFVLDEDE